MHFIISKSNGTIGFPDPEPMPNDDRNTPYFILGDDAFGLRTYLIQLGLTNEQLITNYIESLEGDVLLRMRLEF